jgi:hypothetical protein
MEIKARHLAVAVVVIVLAFLTGNGRIFGVAGPVSDDQAAKYVGRRTTVHGIVAGVREVSGTTYIDFGGEYPAQAFSALISGEQYPAVSRAIPLPDEEGGFGEYWVTGRVELVDGQPIIRITKRNQIVSDAQLAQDDRNRNPCGGDLCKAF